MNQFQKKLIIATVIYVLMWNGQYFLEGLPQPLDFFIIPFLVVLLFGLLLFSIGQLFLVITEKFGKLNRLAISMSIIMLLPLSYLYPRGLINFEKYLESENLLIASYESVANCMTTLSFKKNRRFKKKIVCFGINTVWGRYVISNDTLYMKFNMITNDNGEGAYAVLSCDSKDSPIFKCLKYFQNENDKRWLQFGIKEINRDLKQDLDPKSR